MEILPVPMDEILTRCVELYHPKVIYLYGSYAWGLPTYDSDVDICVILERSSKSQADRMRDGARVLLGVPAAVDLLVLTEDEIQGRKDHPSTLIYQIIHHGKKLYEAA